MPAIQEIVDVSIRVQSSAVAAVNFDSILIAGDGGSGTNDGDFNAGFLNHEVRRYTSLSALSADSDIKPNSNVVNIATAIFGQIPAVPTVYVGRIDQGTPSIQFSRLKFNTVPLIAGQSVEVFIDGASIGTVPFNTNNDTTIADVAALILSNSKVSSVSVSGTPDDTIGINGATAGESFTVSADIKTGSVVDESKVAEILVRAIDLISVDDINSLVASNNDWFGYVHTFTSNADAATAAAALAANKKFGSFLTKSVSAPPVLNSNFSSLWYTSSSSAVGQWVNAAALSAMLGRPFGSYNPSYLSLELVDAETGLTATQETALRAAYVNQYSPIAGRNVTYNGLAGNGGWIDTYLNVLYLENRMESSLVGLLIAQDKIPYDDSGIARVANVMSSILQASENAGIIANNPKYSITVPLASSVPAIDRSNRILNGLSFTAYTGAGVNLIRINGTLVD